MGKNKKEKSPWVKVKKRLRNLTWIGERISLNWMKVYSFRQSSQLSLLYWHWYFKLFRVLTHLDR